MFFAIAGTTIEARLSLLPIEHFCVVIIMAARQPASYAGRRPFGFVLL